MGKLKKTFSVVSKSKKENKGKLNEDPSKKKGKKTHVLKISNPGGVRRIISKKEKQKVKSQMVREKLQHTKEAFKEDKAKKKRQKTAIVGDLKPLLDSLPSLDELLTLREESNKTGIASIDKRIKNRSRSKAERRKQLRNEKTDKPTNNFDNIKKVWTHPEFLTNPRKLIADQIRKRRVANEMEI